MVKVDSLKSEGNGYRVDRNLLKIKTIRSPGTERLGEGLKYGVYSSNSWSPQCRQEYFF
jgi:hypothetical protein